MNRAAAYIEYHPKWYRYRLSTWWWLGRWAFLRFILRELSSVFVAWFVVVTLAQIFALSKGAEAYARFQTWLTTPVILTLNVVALLFIVFHAVTWFNLAPKALVVHWRGRPVPGRWIAAGNYAAWLVVSAVVAWTVLRG